MRGIGQVSIEVLLLLAVLLGFVGASLAALSSIYSAASFAADAGAAKSFTDSILQKAAQLSLLGDGSQFELSARPAGKWEFIQRAGSCTLSLESRASIKKEFPVPQNVKCALSANEFSKNFSVKLYRKDGALILADN